MVLIMNLYPLQGGCVFTFGPCVSLIREKVSGRGYSKM